MSVPGNILIIILQMFRHSKYYQPYKINPKTDINEELIAHDSLNFVALFGMKDLQLILGIICIECKSRWQMVLYQ